MTLPDHYRYPVPTPRKGHGPWKISALDAAEVEMGRDREFPKYDHKAMLPREDAHRLGQREKRWVEVVQRRRALRKFMDELLPTDG